MKFLIVCGSFRSGTTIVSKMFSQHSELLFTSEVLTFKKNLSLVNSRLRLEDSNMNAGVKTTLKFNLKENYKLFIDYAAKTPFESMEDFITTLSKWSNKDFQYYGDKYPEYVLELSKLTKDFKDLKIIFCIRDGRDVIESQIRNYVTLQDLRRFHYWCVPNIESAVSCSFNWWEAMNAWEEAKQTLKLDYYELYYRNLVNNLEQEAINISEFLKIDSNELVNIFKKDFKAPRYQTWKIKYPYINKYLPEKWKVMLLKHGFLS